jgi:hypothetical protein
LRIVAAVDFGGGKISSASYQLPTAVLSSSTASTWQTRGNTSTI